jgi:hypothetical protein
MQYKKDSITEIFDDEKSSRGSSARNMERALRKIQALEKEKEALSIPINEHILYYTAMTIGFTIQVGWLIILVLKG